MANISSVTAFDWTYPAALIWGVMVVAALAGWGSLVGRFLQIPSEPKSFGLGLASTLGLAVFIFLAGALLLCGWFSKAFVALFLISGLGFVAVDLLGKKSLFYFPWPKHRGVQILGGFVLLLAIFLYAEGAAKRDYNEWDDFAAYFTFPKMMVDTGTFLDPFSFRRLSTLGGQAALQTLILSFVPWKYAHLLDCGIALLILLALAQEQISENSTPAFLSRLCLGLLALIFPIPRFNTSSELTGAVLILALLRSFDLVMDKTLSGWRAALLIALVAGAGATLRTPNFFGAGLLCLGYFVWRLWEDRQERPAAVQQAILASGATVLYLLPWMIVSQISSGTFLYPLIDGNHRREFVNFNANLPAFAFVLFVGGYFCRTKYLLFFIPVCLLHPGRARQAALVAGAALLAISIALVSKLTASSYFHINRYIMPLGFGFFLYTCGLLAQWLVSEVRQTGGSAWPRRAVLACLFAILVLGYLGFLFLKTLPYRVETIQSAVTGDYEFKAALMETTQVPSTSDYRIAKWTDTVIASTDQIAADYATGMNQIPRGSKVLIAVDYPFLLDYRAHQMFNIDEPGAVSPDPGFPYFRGSAAVKAYLQGQGISYIAYVPFDRSTYLYSMRCESANLSGPVPETAYFAKYELDFMKNINDLADSNPILYQSDVIRIMALR